MSCRWRVWSLTSKVCAGKDFAAQTGRTPGKSHRGNDSRGRKPEIPAKSAAGYQYRWLVTAVPINSDHTPAVVGDNGWGLLCWTYLQGAMNAAIHAAHLF